MPNSRLPLLIPSIDDLRERVGRWRRSGQRIALVPTMGNLHDGHLALVRQVRPLADVVIASVFVNPLQFGEGEDFDSYPRTLADDRQMLATARADAVFHPTVLDMYPDGAELKTIVRVPELEKPLCGQHRDEHFSGVATVVTKLLCLVQPDMAIFGRKDYQQLTLIRQLVIDLNLPVTVLAGDTVRETDGLAMSSRNRYLDPAQRALAPTLYATLRALREQLLAEQGDVTTCVEVAVKTLNDAGLVVDYVNVLDARTLQAPGADTTRVVAAAAAHLGRARLIDNVVFDLTV